MIAEIDHMSYNLRQSHNSETARMLVASTPPLTTTSRRRTEMATAIVFPQRANYKPDCARESEVR